MSLLRSDNPLLAGLLAALAARPSRILGRKVVMKEFFLVVGPEDTKNYTGEIIPYGCVARDLAHSDARVPHATVQIIPVRFGTQNVFIHQRSKHVRNSPKKWDFFGGHISFEMGMLLSSSHTLAEASLDTARREAQEEILITVGGIPHLFQKKDFQQIGQVGQFTYDGSHNVEYSTAFVVCIGKDAIFDKTPFESKREGRVEWLIVEEIEWSELLRLYEASISATPPHWFQNSSYNKGFADGLSRILNQVRNSSDIGHQIEFVTNSQQVWAKKEDVYY
jgi:8-oxo-dGTP pyrophosphatase MutT (NUDIX family)